MATKISYRLVKNKADLKAILDKIDIRMFNADRIYLDYTLLKVSALRRCHNWIKDEFAKKKAIMGELIFNKRTIGFFLLRKENEEIMHSVLAGVFSRYKNLGLGAVAIGKHIDYTLKADVRKVTAEVSSNNLESLRMHLSFGYEIKRINYVFRKNFKI